MNTMILAGLPREFDVLAMQAALGGDIGARLEALVERTREAAGTGAGWQQHVEAVRGKLKLPHDPHGFYADAIRRLTALIEEA